MKILSFLFKKTFLGLILFGYSQLCYSQSFISAKAGTQFGNATLKGAAVGHITPTLGFSGGFSSYIKFTDHLRFRPELLFSSKGFRMETEDYDHIYRFNYIELPLLFSYQFGQKEDGFIVTLGAYGGRGIGGKASVKRNVFLPEDGRVIYTRDVNDENKPLIKGNDYVIRPYDYGVVGGIGYKFKNFILDLSTQRSLHNLEPLVDGKPYDGDLKFTSYKVSLSYLIAIPD